MGKRQRYQKSAQYGGKEVELDVWRGSHTVKELQSLRRKLAKRANQRIVRLERATSKITGESFADFGAVQDAYQYLENQQKGRKRFQERANAVTDINYLRQEITALQGFLGRKTSLVSGQRDIEKKRIKAFESGKWGAGDEKRRRLEFASTKEFYNFLQSQAFRSLIQYGYTSEQIIEMYDEAREKYEGFDNEVLDRIEEALNAFREGEKATLKSLSQKLGLKTVT